MYLYTAYEYILSYSNTNLVYLTEICNHLKTTNMPKREYDRQKKRTNDATQQNPVYQSIISVVFFPRRESPRSSTRNALFVVEKRSDSLRQINKRTIRYYKELLYGKEKPYAA